MKKKIIIVGGGIAGLSAGVYAQMAGFASEIYEKNQVAGGQCMGWDRKNHHIDNCIHWLTGTKYCKSMATVTRGITNSLYYGQICNTENIKTARNGI